MARYCPQSQAQSVLDEKRALVQRLLAQGLTVKQITMQLHCSDQFVYRIRHDVRSMPQIPDLM
jgi:DNA-binding NarL/FixJ family response regulator